MTSDRTTGAPSGRRSPRAGTDRGPADGGYALILTALLILPLMAFTGFAVDLGAWYSRASQLQRAAEAAALAGVTYMPDFGEAERVALEVADANGFPDAGAIDVQVDPAGDGRSALRVSITDTSVNQYFTSLFVDDVDITRGAVAEYVSPIRMGSPYNFLGNDPIEGERPNYWLVTFGNTSPKGQGDRYHTSGCGSEVGCSGGTNQDYDPDGYYFTAGVKGSPPGEDLRFQVFDPFFYDFANSCNVGFLPTAATVNNPAGFYGTNFPYVNGDANLQQRFSRGNHSWCTGDSDGGTPEPTTTYIVREPSTDPFDPTAGDIICAVSFDPINITDETDFRNKLQSTNRDNWDADILVDTFGTAANPGPSANDGADELTFERGWRRWVDICSVPGGSVQEGEYVIQVRTNANPSDPGGAPSTSGKGNPRYSLRTGWDSGTTDVLGSYQVDRVAGGTSVSLGAISRLPVFVNSAPAGNLTEFYMARVTPDYKGKTLVLDIYDTTDGGALDRLELIPPSEATYDPGGGTVDLDAWPASACEFFRVTGPNNNPTKADVSAGAAGGMARTGDCSMSATSGSGNGYAIRVEIDLPTTYSCNPDDPFGCWVIMQLDYATAPQDTTTWSATIDGDPVRLIG